MKNEFQGVCITEVLARGLTEAVSVYGAVAGVVRPQAKVIEEVEDTPSLRGIVVLIWTWIEQDKYNSRDPTVTKASVE